MKQLTKKDLEKLPHRFQVDFAIFCAKQVIHLIEDEHREVCEKAIATTEAYLEGETSKKDYELAVNAAYVITRKAHITRETNISRAAIYAAYTAIATVHDINTTAYTVITVSHTIEAARDEQTIEEQIAYYNELLNFDKIFEEEVL